MNTLLVTFLNEPEFICLLTVQWFQVLLCTDKNNKYYYVRIKIICIVT